MKNFLIYFFILLFLYFPSRSLYCSGNETQVDVLYFHATTRCHGCLTIEDYIKNTLNTQYMEKLADSSLIFKSIDFQQSENEHFQDDYKFDVQTLILSKKIDGKEVMWKNLDKIWEYSSDYQKFRKYIIDEINAFIK